MPALHSPLIDRVVVLALLGGPDDDAKDNTIFGNREGLLPPRDDYDTDDHNRSFRRIGGVNR